MNVNLAIIILLVIGIFSIQFLINPSQPESLNCQIEKEYVPIACVTGGTMMQLFEFERCS